MNNNSPENKVRTSTTLGPTYQGLVTRYSSNFSTQWQVLGLGLAAQGFVVGAASQVTGRIITAILLSVLILAIGAVTIVSSIRIGLFAGVDRYMLDEYEKILLTDSYQSLRLDHRSTYRSREQNIPETLRPGMRASKIQRLVINRIVKPLGPSYTWVILELLISLIGATIPVLGVFSTVITKKMVYIDPR